MEGFEKGMDSQMGSIKKKATEIAQSALKSAKAALDEHSPSKEFEKVGSYAGEGLVIGIDKWISKASAAGADIAGTTLNSAKEAIKGIRDVIDGSVNLNPVIKPILDLDGVRSGAQELNGMFKRNTISGSIEDPQNGGYIRCFWK